MMRDVKREMHDAVKSSVLSRDQVVDMMNDLAARYGVKLNGRGGLSKDVLEKWLNVDNDSHFPSVKGLFFFCASMQTMEPFAVAVRLLGGDVIDSNDVAMLKWAKKYHQAKELRKQMKELEGEL